MNTAQAVRLASDALLSLGARAARCRPSLRVGYLEDGARWLSSEPRPAHPPRWIDVPPGEDACGTVAGLRRQFPRAHLHGLTPGWLTRQPAGTLARLLDAGLNSLALYTGPVAGESPHARGWEELLEADVPKVACLVYGPADPSEAVVERLARLGRASGLGSVVCLPAAPGDLMLIQGATTDGNLDMQVLAASRIALPGVHVRASWGALGWKVAQVALAFGADELAGFGLEERLTYSGRTRPASIVEAEEVRSGIREAGLEPREVDSCDWAS